MHGGCLQCACNWLLYNLQPAHVLCITSGFTVGGVAILALYIVLFFIPSFPPVDSAPTNMMAVQGGLTSIRVSWTPSSDATGYIISYTGGGSSDSVTVSGGSTDNYLLTGLVMEASYTISIIATSQQFPSDAVVVEITLSKKNTYSNMYAILSPCACM